MAQLRVTPSTPATEGSQQPVKLEAPSDFTLSEALLTLDFLQKRGLLCTGCGFRQPIAANQLHSHCEECKRPNMNYTGSFTKATELDRILCKRIEGWFQRFVGSPAEKQGNGQAASKPANHSGKA